MTEPAIRKMRRLFLYLMIPLSGILTIQAQIQLDTCQVKAKRNYPLIKQFDLIDQTEEFNISNANKAFLPQLQVNLIGGLVDGFPDFSIPGSEGESTSNAQLIGVVQLNQAIWDGGATKAKKELISAQTELDKAGVEVQLYQIRQRVNQLFFGILLIDEQTEQNQIYLNTLERHQHRVKAAVENGIAYRTDLDEIEVEILQLEQQEETLQYNRKVYISLLAAMTGESIPPDAALIIPADHLVTATSITGRPELDQFEQQRALIEAQSSMNKTQLYPKVGLLGFGTFLNPGINFGPDNIDRILVAGLSVSWNIGGLYRNANNKKLDELQLQLVDNREETFLFQTDLQVDQLSIELEKMRAMILKSEERFQIKQRIKEGYVAKYDNGICTLTELLDKTNEENLAAQELSMLRIQYLQKVYDYNYQNGI